MSEVEKERLHRLRMLYIEHPIYFVTMRAHDQRCRLDRPAMHDAFKKFGSDGVTRGCCIGKYVLMPDHLHLFVRFNDAPAGSLARLSSWVRVLKNSLSKIWRAQGLAATHWQKGFFSTSHISP